MYLQSQTGIFGESRGGKWSFLSSTHLLIRVALTLAVFWFLIKSEGKQ